MDAVWAAGGCLVTYFFFYRFYARYLGRVIFRLDPEASTPAHSLRDNIDYLPCHRTVLFGHHYASIAGLSPMLGPAIAVIWGWVPGMLWVVFGTLLIGAVHDFGALVLSMRHRGLSIGKVAEEIIGSRAKSLFHALIFFLVCLAMGVFVHVVASLFTTSFYPEAVFPTFSLIAIALVAGWASFKRAIPIWKVTSLGFLLMLITIWLGIQAAKPDLSTIWWGLLILVYAFVASTLPVWALLQPRDYLNSFLLYLGLGSAYLGFFILSPPFVAPALDPNPSGAPTIFPFVFIVIACGAISGFHGLVSSGTTSKQISRETDALAIGYGGMIGESLLGLLAVLACTAGFQTVEAWNNHYQSWSSAGTLSEKMRAFIDGAALFISELGIPFSWAQAFIALVAVSFALTSLDSGTRLLRYNINEIGAGLRLPILTNSTSWSRTFSSLLASASIGFFAFYEVDGKPAGLLLWKLFGSTNQILGALTLLTIAIYLRQRQRNHWFATVPMLFMISVTMIAMVIEIEEYWSSNQYLLLSVGGVIFLLSLWVLLEASIRFRKDSHSCLPPLSKASAGTEDRKI